MNFRHTYDDDYYRVDTIVCFIAVAILRRRIYFVTTGHGYGLVASRLALTLNTYEHAARSMAR